MNPQLQPVLAPLTASAIFLVFTIDPGGEEELNAALAEYSGLVRTVTSRRPPVEPAGAVLGIGSDAWDRLFDGPKPAGLHPFIELTGDVHRAPATPGDLMLHIRAERQDLCFEIAKLVTERFASCTTVVDEVHGFRNFDQRAMIGFVDGTENPSGPAANASVFVAEADDPGFGGGSYVVVQKYLHDMSAWDGLGTTDQEAAIGRSKWENIEMADDVKPSNSHIALNVIVDPDGTQRQIVRANMPFGRPGFGEFGTFFIGYSSDQAVTEEMLQNMFIGDPPGNYDRLLDFSDAVTGSQYFVPTIDFLDQPPPLPQAAAATSDEPDTAASIPTGSLTIGSLKEHS
nr:Dyp-type peroxidase [Jongsikchunia kroppenstedtii]